MPRALCTIKLIVGFVTSLICCTTVIPSCNNAIKIFFTAEIDKLHGREKIIEATYNLVSDQLLS